MRKKLDFSLIFLLIFFAIIIFLILLLADNGHTTTPIVHHYSIEISEWILFSLILPVINILLWRNKTIWPKKLNWEEHITYKTFKKTGITNNLFYITSPLLLSLIIFLPNNWGWLNHISYVNAKVFIGSIFTTLLLINATKHFIIRKRPDFEERVKLNHKVEAGYQSFFSAHSALAFNSAVFFSLFSIEHLEIEPILKGSIVLGLLGSATFSSINRIINNKSHSEDVFVGAFIGSLIGFLFYAVPNDWFGQVYTRIPQLEAYNNLVNTLTQWNLFTWL